MVIGKRFLEAIGVLVHDLLYCVKMPLAHDSSMRSGGGTGAITNKHFGHGPPVSEGRAVSDVEGAALPQLASVLKNLLTQM